MSINDLKKERKMVKRENMKKAFMAKMKELFLEAYEGDFMSIGEFIGGVLLIAALFLIVGVAGEIEIANQITGSSIMLLAISGGYMGVYALIKLFWED